MKILLVLPILFFTQTSFAKTIFEPTLSLGSATGAATVKTELLGSTTADGGGSLASFGFRYGITRDYIHLTGILEGMYFLPGDSDMKANFTGFVGLGLGWEWNIPIRTYLITGAIEFDTDYMASGVELSYFISEKMWLGVRYLQYKAGVSSNISGASVEADVQANFVSVILSYPFEFNYPDHWFRKVDWE